MKIEISKDFPIYRVWYKNEKVQIKEFILLKKDGGNYTLKNPRNNEILTLPIKDDEFFFDKKEAISNAMKKTTNLQGGNKPIIKQTSTPILLTGRFKDIVRQKKLALGSIIYKVYNTTTGAKVEKYTIKNFLNNALLVANEEGKEYKFYQDEIENLFNGEEMEIEVKRLKEIGPLAKQDRDICWACRNFFDKAKQPKCSLCGGAICPVCGKCLCNYHYIPKDYF